MTELLSQLNPIPDCIVFYDDEVYSVCRDVARYVQAPPMAIILFKC